MKWILCLMPFLTLPPAPVTFGARPDKGTLDVRIENIVTNAGTLWIGVYESEDDFLDRERARLIHQPVRHVGEAQVRIDNLTVNKRYAIAVFQDVNDNGDLDTNWLGLPAEPYALSRPLQSWFRAPRFEEMSFVFHPGEELPPMRLR
ncbi:DUF2141 domain-containing protein [Lewinella sp. IMCC34191]|uniref:DUF2141 domain-containing protein n=1 Tax=Lewinella sp. IMCC34191 TaxID=2259172 RepID=UPI000E24CB07|nr:DUF2141 domain-containing protein [Lewinella sp. IMCC34191]